MKKTYVTNKIKQGRNVSFTVEIDFDSNTWDLPAGCSLLVCAAMGYCPPLGSGPHRLYFCTFPFLVCSRAGLGDGGAGE